MKKYIKLLCFALAMALLTALISGRIFAAGNSAPVNNAGSSGGESDNEFLIVGWRDKSFHEAVTSVRVNGVELLEYNPSPFDYAPPENVVSAPASGELSVEITLEDGYVLSNRDGSVIILSGVQSATDIVTAGERADSITLPSADWLENDEELYLSFTTQRDLRSGESIIIPEDILIKVDKIDCGTEITDEMLPVVKTPSGVGYRVDPSSVCLASLNGNIFIDHFSPFTVSGNDSPVLLLDMISRGQNLFAADRFHHNDLYNVYYGKSISTGLSDYITEDSTDPGTEATAQELCLAVIAEINHKSVIQEATDEALGLKGGPCSVCGEIEEDGMYLLKDTSPYRYPDGETISDSGETRSLSEIAAFDGSTAEVIIQDPLGVIPDDAEISIDGAAADPGRYYDGDYRVDSALNVSVSLKDTQGIRIPGLFTDYVRILIEIPDDWDEDELKTLDVNIYDDLVFADRIEYRVYDADGNFIRTADKDYQPAEGETIKKFAAFWTDNLGDFAVMDTLTDEEDFGHYKEEAKETADGLAHDGDSEEIQALIKTAKDEIDTLAYDESKTLDENKAAVDAIVSKLENDIAEHRKKYTATFIADGKTVDEVTFTIDTDSITEPDVPIKEGYTGVWEEYTLGSEDITVNAVYTLNEYTITYVIDGNETEVKYNFGAPVDKPADPVKDGFDFIGWDAEIPDTMPAENLTITAEFEIIPTEPTPTEPTPTEPTPTEPTPTEPTPTEPTPTEAEPAHEHDYKGEVTTEPTCTEDGIMTYTCECGESYTQVIPKTGHKPGAWEVVTPATTEAAGKEVRKCETCGAVIAEREIAKLEPQETDAGIVGVNLEKINDYGIANAFGVDPEKLPAGSTVTWYVNGEKAGEGNGFRVENPTEDYTIKAVVTNRDGKVIGETEEVTVKVNNSFFARIYYWLCRIIQKVIDLFKK